MMHILEHLENKAGKFILKEKNPAGQNQTLVDALADAKDKELRRSLHSADSDGFCKCTNVS